jgi:hypothetical protein
VAVTIDHARDDRRAAGVDDLESVGRTRILLAVRRADPGDPVALDEDADTELEAIASCVGEGAVAIEDTSAAVVVHVPGSLAPASIGAC